MATDNVTGSVTSSIEQDVVRVVTEVGALVASSHEPAPRPRDFADVRRLLDENDELARGPSRDVLASAPGLLAPMVELLGTT